MPATGESGLLRLTLNLTGTAGEAQTIRLEAGMANASPVAMPPLRAIAARQDLYLDPEGHKVSVLFNRILPRETDLLPLFAPKIAFNRDGVVVDAARPIFAAALQDGGDVVNLSFDHVLTTNATYSIALDPQISVDPSIVPKIDNDRPAGILYGKFLRGDNTPIVQTEVRLYTGHFVGCKSGLFDDGPPPDCNPYREAPQYAKTDDAGSFLFEYVPRDPIGDHELQGGYRLLGVNTDGRFTIVNGAVRLPGSVHFVNLQLLGRGAAEGTVRYDNGEKVAGAEVYVGSTMFSIGRKAISDTNGFFRVDDLPVGPITFSAKDAAGNIAFASGEIATPGEVSRKDIVIHRQPFPGTGTVFGVVLRSDDNKPAAGARVGVFSQGYGLSETFTDAQGKYEFRKVPAGFVTVLAADWSIAVDSIAYDLDLRRDESRELPPLILPIRMVNAEVATITGVVEREDPLRPGDPGAYQRVAGIVVKLGDRPPVMTDSQGRFAFDGIPVQWGNVIDVQAYDPETKRTATVRLPHLTAAGPNDVAIFLPAGSFGQGLIRVTLVNALGSPVSGFRVLEPGFPPVPLIEVGQGLYEYRNAPVGADVQIYAVQGPSEYGEQFARGTASLTFPGQIATVTLRLPGDGTVRVKLRSDFDLIGDVALTYDTWDDAEQAPLPKTISSTTQENGQAGWATFTRVPALQRYSAASLHPVYGYATAAGSLAYQGDLVDHILQLNRLSTVRGTVYAIDGVTPIAGATVRIDDGRRDPGSLVTQPDGTFVFHDVPAATPFRITADVTQSGIYRTGVAYGSTPPNGGPVEAIAVLLRRRGSVEGRVVYEGTNQPVPLAKFWLRELGFPNRTFGTDAAPLAADSSGRFVIPNVFVGPLRARAWDPGNQELEGTWSGELSQEGEILTSVTIVVGNGGTGSVAVAVVDPNQQLLPIPNAEVSLYAGSGLFDLGSTDGTGVTRFDSVPAGSYTVSAYSKALGKLGASTAFIVVRDQTTDVRVLLEFSGQVTGTLTDPQATNAPVPGAAVTLTGSNYQSRTSTEISGAFEFEGVREGTFVLDAKDTQTNRRARASRSLSAADPQPHVDLQLEPTTTLHVAVYLPNDSGASSTVLAPPVEVTATQRGEDYLRTIQGNPAQLTGLFLNEPYNVVVREIGGLQRTFIRKGVEFPTGSASNPLTFVYGASGNVEIRVTQAGVPASGARVDVHGGGKSVTLFTGVDGRVLAQNIPLGAVSAQARSIDGAFSGSASGTLALSSVPLLFDIDLGSYAGITGIVEAEAGGPSAGTRVVASFDGRTLEMYTDGDGRYTFQGIRTQPGSNTNVHLVYVGPDGVTIGAQQTAVVTAAHASQIVSLPGVRLDATPPRLLDVIPADGANDVAPDSFLRFTFSESIQPALVNNANFQLVAADGSGQVFCTFDAPALQPDGRVVITMRPPPAAPFPLKSNTLYRIIVSGQIADLTGHTLGTSRGLTFTTTDYAEPRVVKVLPGPNTPATRSQTFEFHFSEPITPPASFRFVRISASGGEIVAE
ncbi:MAG TPA: carboxypeptidase regulatory-like domain-containing protein, partial [Thermoanaerobaculia bacterium]|nr:carboxypeptidase regulatory-like domain-containing protein [Thermoanaerobaculia bacterium]